MTVGLFLTALAMTQSVEQIPQATRLAAAVQADQAHDQTGDRTSIAQLPADARAVEQPRLVERPKDKGDATVEAARAYVAILGSGPGPGIGGMTELGPHTIAEAAAAASLSTNSTASASNPHSTPKP